MGDSHAPIPALQPRRERENSSSQRDTRWRTYLQLCSGRDQHALAALYDESSALVYGIALRLLGNEDDAGQVVVDVFRKVWDSAGEFDEDRGSATAWLVMLARCRAIDRRRRLTVQNRVEVTFAEAPSVASTAPSPEGLASASEATRKVMSALAQLPAEQRRAVELAYYSGRSHSEIAAYLQEPLGTVKTRIRLGLAKLRDVLKGSYV
ncbi:MAG: sigma-70 family RNA polymerase sigma factor [Acidobacteriaceae bacterium]|nr:sigma-70 family RNA polymerase sigma factor [Acidobacteriaceae bacterium]